MRIIADRAIADVESFLLGCGNVELMLASQINATAVRDADVLLVRSRTRVTPALLQGSKVRFVGSCVSGVDHVDQEWLRRAGIVFAHAHGCNADSVAEYVATVIMHYVFINKTSFDTLSVGVIGVGAVGTRLVEVLQTLGIEVHTYDPLRAEAEGNKLFDNLDAVKQSEIISLHVPFSMQGKYPTKNFVDTDFLKTSKVKCLINAARGEVIDELALRNYPLDFCALDCWQNEPDINLQLIQKSSLATPHIAGHSWNAKVAGTRMVVQQMKKTFALPEQQKADSAVTKKISLKLNDFSSFEEAVCAFAKLCYNPLSDCLKDKGLNVITAFERHRNNYPKRCEWIDCTVQLHGKKDVKWAKRFEHWLLENRVKINSWNESSSSFVKLSTHRGKLWEKGGC